tara:strand:+ start:834 stop:2015 length:1182 start_codon:yes stop_codon:yes gene_type:complete
MKKIRCNSSFLVFKTLLILSLLTTYESHAALINPEVIIYNETGEEMWFYEDAAGKPSSSKSGGNTVESKKLPKDRAMVVNRNSLFKWKSGLAFYTNDYKGKKCAASGKTEFRQMNYGIWEHRKATSSEKKSYQKNYDNFKEAEKGTCKSSDTSVMCLVAKRMTEVAKDELDDASDEDWRSKHQGKECLDNQFTKACLVVVAYSDSIKVYQDDSFRDVCDKSAWKEFKYAASDLPGGDKVVDKIEDLEDKAESTLDTVVGALDGVTRSACDSAIDTLAGKLKPSSSTKYLNTSCLEGTFKGFTCSAPAYLDQFKNAPKDLKDTVKKYTNHKDCKNEGKVSKAACSIFKVVATEAKRPVKCMNEMAKMRNSRHCLRVRLLRTAAAKSGFQKRHAI